MKKLNVALIIVSILLVSACESTKYEYGFTEPSVMQPLEVVSCDELYHWAGLIMSARQEQYSIVEVTNYYKEYKNIVFSAYENNTYASAEFKVDMARSFAEQIFTLCINARENN